MSVFICYSWVLLQIRKTHPTSRVVGNVTFPCSLLSLLAAHDDDATVGVPTPRWALRMANNLRR